LICPLTRKPVSEEEFYALADNNYLAMIRAIRKSKAKFLSWKNKAKTSRRSAVGETSFVDTRSAT